MVYDIYGTYVDGLEGDFMNIANYSERDFFDLVEGAEGNKADRILVSCNI
jgi:hypothetical protein